MTNEPGDGEELEVSDLRPQDARGAGAVRRGPAWRIFRILRGQRWRWAPLVVSLALLAALVLSFAPQGGDLLSALRRASQPTPTFVASSIQIVSEPAATPLPTTILRTPPAPTLGRAPASCGGPTPVLGHVGPPHWGAAIGKAPVWLARVSGVYPTIHLGPAAQANAYSWDAPYTQLGWPAPIGLDLQGGFQEPVQLSGWNVSDGKPVAFGFIVAGVWGAPHYVSTSYTLDPTNPDLPAGGSDGTGEFWYGYVFLPSAGCYALNASWSGGWQVMVSAGR